MVLIALTLVSCCAGAFLGRHAEGFAQRIRSRHGALAAVALRIGLSLPLVALLLVLGWMMWDYVSDDVPGMPSPRLRMVMAVIVGIAVGYAMGGWRQTALASDGVRTTQAQ